MSSNPKCRTKKVASSKEAPTDKTVDQEHSTPQASAEDEKTEKFMGLEELFWQCYGVRPKPKPER